MLNSWNGAKKIEEDLREKGSWNREEITDNKKLWHFVHLHIMYNKGILTLSKIKFENGAAKEEEDCVRSRLQQVPHVLHVIMYHVSGISML